MNLPTPPEAKLITDNSALEKLCERWRKSGHITHLALDTEFIRTRTFFPKLGLVQVADQTGMYLLDGIAVSEWEPFCQVLEDQSLIKVLHSPSEDFEVFRHAFDVVPDPIVDTQIAATLAGVEPMPGYARLIQSMFEVDLPKGEQRSDWLRRPLSFSQMLYAGLDVAYLLPAWEILDQTLQDLGRGDWLVEEMKRMRSQSEAKNAASTIYGRLARSNLRELQAGTLFELVKWREHHARRRNIPRRFVVGDDVLLSLARNRPKDVEAVESTDGLDGRQKKRLAKELLQVVTSSRPRNLESERIDHVKVSKSRLRLVRDELETVSEELDIPLSFLASKKVLEKLIRRWSGDHLKEVPKELRGWRWEEFGDRLLHTLAGS